MGKPKAPTPPDPAATASAQTGTNIGTAIANTHLGQVNQYGPQGSLTYNQIGSYDYTDPTSGKTYAIPKFSATTTLTPEAQRIYDQYLAAQNNLAGTANDQSKFLKDYLGKPADFDTTEIEGRLIDLGRERLDPRFEREGEALRTSLVNRGIAEGSEVWNKEMERFGQGKNDAYNNLLLTGRGQAFQELMAKRNQPINEITALLSGSQVAMPNYAPATPDKAPTTDYAGIVANNYNQQLQNYNARMGSWNSMMGGLFGLGAAGIRAFG